MDLTKLEDLINPELMADMIGAKLESKIAVIPYAKLDRTLEGNEGDTITVPYYGYIGDAVDVAEGEEIPIRKLTTSTKQYTIKMAGIGTEITDKALTCGHGDPVGASTSQIATSIDSKCDNDAVSAMYEAKTIFDSKKVIAYDGIVNALDLFDEEVDTEKILYVHPKQKTQLRRDPEFISKEKYGNEVMMTGEIGMIGGARVIASKKVKLIKYELDNESGTITIVADSVSENGTQKHLSTVMKNFVGELKVGNKVKAVEKEYYLNPIIKLEEDKESELEVPALTYYLKRATNIETQRFSKRRCTEITGDQMYVVALTNETKVVILKSLAVASV